VVHKNVAEQLAMMQIVYDTFTPMRSKDSVHVYRVLGCGVSFVLKYFENESDRREIENYRILSSLSVPTIKLIAHTDSALLMEDIEQSAMYRLGVKADLNDEAIAAQIAKWYKQLHDEGRDFIASHGVGLYDETDVITEKNVEYIITKTNTAGNPAWDVLRAGFPMIKKRIAQAERTLTYNDFYFTNLIVAKDLSSALMFDYNLLGKGYMYADIRNVCSSLSERAKAAFLCEYGGFSGEEALIDDVASVLTTLFFGCKRAEFPAWALEALERVHNGDLLKALNNLLYL